MKKVWFSIGFTRVSLRICCFLKVLEGFGWKSLVFHWFYMVFKIHCFLKALEGFGMKGLVF